MISHILTQCECLACAFPGVLLRPCFLPFFFFFCAWTVTSHGFTVYALFSTVHVLKNIKNGSHDTIYTIKNYFATVFSVFSFQFSVFSNNKLNPNTPFVSLEEIRIFFFFIIFLYLDVIGFLLSCYTIGIYFFSPMLFNRLF